TACTATFGGESQVWYNNVLAVHPTDPTMVYAGMTSMYRTTNGGTNWATTAGTVHVDHHAVVFDAANPTRMVIGSDGGVFVSSNTGTSWVKSLNLPISQFYAGTVDFTNPQRTFGGLQDNGTPRTLTGNQNDWSSIYGGDGFYVLVDPTNPNRIYAESQNGGLGYSTNGGTSFSGGTSGITSTDRKNWSTPIAMDLSHPLTLYTGTHRAYRTKNGMQSWTVISGDLTRGDGGRIGTISTIDAATTDSNVVYVGTDDGKVQVTTNGGTSWNDVTGSLPVRYVTRVTVDPDSANVCYLTISGYLEYVYQAHIYRTTNYGQTWTAIGGNLPNIPLNDVIVDAAARPRLYVASDAGVLYSTNYGTTWQVLGSGLPTVPVHDLTLHSPTRKLVAFTHGRSAWSLDVTTITGVGADAAGIPGSIELYQNYPNPFNPTTTISFNISTEQFVSLKIFDVLGKEIASLVNEKLSAGTHSRVFAASTVPSGVYFYRLQAGSRSLVKKLTVLK
ncbi:MAG: T9SS type A sorting domain-containing protein, partial [bacterium]